MYDHSHNGPSVCIYLLINVASLFETIAYGSCFLGTLTTSKIYKTYLTDLFSTDLKIENIIIFIKCHLFQEMFSFFDFFFKYQNSKLC
jgi:hypothetical protein